MAPLSNLDVNPDYGIEASTRVNNKQAQQPNQYAQQTSPQINI